MNTWLIYAVFMPSSTRSRTVAELLPIHRLETYTQDHPQEVLLVRAAIAGEPAEILVFRGFPAP